MKIKEAYISNTIDSAKDKIQYDEHVRQILKDKGILAYILKYAVKEFKDYSIDDAKAAIDGEPEVAIRSVHPEAVSTLENESKIPGEGKMYFDILFYAVTNDGYRQKMYINIEAQKSFYPGYDLVTRGIVYPARLISQQMDVEYTADNYDGVKKVYSVWICMNAPEKKHSYKKVADSIVEYSIKPTILYPHNATDDEIATGRYDLMSTVFINLNSQNTINSKNVLISMLSTLLSDKIKADEKKQKLEKEYGIKMSKELESEVSSMCNLSEAIEERGIERGRMYTIYDFIQSGMITPEAGAQKLGISVEQLKEDMEAAGYHFPD
jgi:hypothetical protein